MQSELFQQLDGGANPTSPLHFSKESCHKCGSIIKLHSELAKRIYYFEVIDSRTADDGIDILAKSLAYAYREGWNDAVRACTKVALNVELPANPKSNIPEKNRTRKEIATEIRNLRKEEGEVI